MNTNKIQIVGDIDGQRIDMTLEFGKLDKGGVIESIRSYSTANPPKALTFTDIHGNMLSLNFSRIKVANLKVIEIVDALKQHESCDPSERTEAHCDK